MGRGWPGLRARAKRSTRRRERHDKAARRRTHWSLGLCLGALTVPAFALAEHHHSHAAHIAQAIDSIDGDGADGAQPLRRVNNWQEARALLRKHHPQLEQAKAQLLSAQAETDRALATLLPQIGVSGGASYVPIRADVIGENNRNWLLDGNAFIRENLSLADAQRYGSSRTARDAEALRLAATRHDLVEGLGVALLQALAGERVTKQYQAGLDAAQTRFDVSQRLLELGRATPLDTIRFEQDLFEAQRALVNAQESRRQAREGLGLALGLPTATQVPEDFELNALLTTAPDSGCRALSAPQERADARAAATAVESAEEAATASRLAYLPELLLSVNYDHRVDTGLSGPAERLRLSNLIVGATLSWTIWDGGIRGAAMDAADAEVRRAQGAERAVRNNLAILGRRSARAVTVAQQNLDIATQALRSAHKADDLSRRAFELGKATALEGVDAARNLRSAQINATLRETDLLIALLRARLFHSQCR